MVTGTLLLNLLQFVALAMPAIAILMQVVMSIHEDEDGTPSGFLAMEVSLHMLLLGRMHVRFRLPFFNHVGRF